MRRSRGCVDQKPVYPVLVDPTIGDRIAERLGRKPIVVDVREIVLGRVADADHGDLVLQFRQIVR